MPRHRLFAGPFAALEERFLAEVGALQSADPLAPVEVLVGSNLLALYLRRRAAEARGGVANLRFLTFLDLSRERLSEPDPRPPLPPLGGALLARRALAETPEGKEFGPLRERRSGAALVERTADDLREAGIPHERWPGLLAAAGSGEERAAFLASVGATLAAFEERRSRFADATSLVARAAAVRLPADDRPLLAYGLYDLGGLREALVGAVAREREVVAFVPEDGGTEAPREAGLPEIRSGLFERLLGVTALLLPAPAAPPAEVVVAPTESAEAREVVRELLRAVDDGIPLHRVAIVLRDPARQEPALVAELNARSLPFFRPAGTGFSRTPVARAARAVLDLVAGDFRSADLALLADLLESLGALAPLTAARAARALADLGFHGGRAGRDDLHRRLADALRRTPPGAALDAAADGRLSRREERRRAARGALEATLRVVEPMLPEGSPAPWSAWGDRLAASFASLAQAAAGVPPGGRDALAEAAASLAALGHVEPGPVEAAEVAALLPDALEESPVSHGRFERDGVALLSAVSARGLLFDAVLVPGLAEQLFPRASRPDPLLLDDERLRVAKAAGAPLAPRSGRRHAREERFLFNLCRGAARKRLVLLAARRESTTDRPRLLSPYLLDVLEETAGVSLRESELGTAAAPPLPLRWLPLGRLVSEGPALDAEEAARRVLADGRRALASLPVGFESVRRAVARGRARAGGAFTAWDGRLGRPTPLLSLTARPLSASRLERLAACPYRAFLLDALGLEARDEPSDPLDPDGLTLGTLAHGALERLARSLRPGSRMADVPESRGRDVAVAVVREALATLETDPPEPLREAVEERLSALVAAVLRREAERGAAALPVSASELRFGPGEAAAEVTVPFAGGPARFRGAADRVDRSGDAALVVDYKFGKPDPFGKTNRARHLVVGGERAQLAVYARLARALGATTVASEYLFVPPPRAGAPAEAVPVTFDEDGTAAAEDGLAEVLALLGEALARGLVFPRTKGLAGKRELCRGCPVADVCGPGHEKVYRRKREGERVREAGNPLFRLEEVR